MDQEQGERTVPLRIRLDFGYDATHVPGWAAQPGLRTVEGTLSAALTTILRAEQPVRLTVAGRTDAGVHARGQVAHFDPDPAAWAALPGRSARTPAASALSRLRGILPADIGMRSVAVAAEGFEARFAALQRRYLYRLADRPELVDPLRRRETVVTKRPLDVEAMHAAAQGLVGLHDFGAFCKRREGATTVRTLLDYSWRRAADGTLEATVVADAFCHSMVRSLVGAVVPVGEGRKGVDWPAEVMRAAVRDAAVVVMPPHGLSLEEVVYPDDAGLAIRAKESRVRRTLG
jgi:tRNA pseudouridine38-40 synthase